MADAWCNNSVGSLSAYVVGSSLDTCLDVIGSWIVGKSRVRECEEGWRPVLRRHGGQGSRFKKREDVVQTLFVDDLPDSMDPKSLYELFSNFGVVKDVFILNKRRKLSRSRFGFVHYDCSVAAKVACQKAHGLWCDNRALKVKVANFGKGTKMKQRPAAQPYRRGNVGTASAVFGLVQGGKSYAQAVNGGGLVANSSLIIKAFEEGNGWLYTSAIVRLKLMCDAEQFKQELKSRGLGVIQVRNREGRVMVMTFDSVEGMKRV
ncbi:hypothetical protein ACSBR1_012277 [Camellia fascicularis]